MAIGIYKQAFEAEVVYLTRFADAPGRLRTPGSEDLIFHATVKFGGTLLNMADDPLEEKISFGGFTLLVHVDSEIAFDRACRVLGDAGTFIWGPTETPWAHRYAVVKDEFGVTWKLQQAES